MTALEKVVPNILYECSCPYTDGMQKIMHHFDYSKPYDVILLCSACHTVEHNRLKMLGMRPVKPEGFVFRADYEKLYEIYGLFKNIRDKVSEAEESEKPEHVFKKKNFCIRCGKEPIMIKKHGFCMRCYRYMYSRQLIKFIF